MMDARASIAAVRDGRATAAHLDWFARGLADGQVTDAQAGAFAMAVLLKGLSDAGRVALTQAMRDSGDVLRWALDGPVIDKHSTGGVGDSISLLLAPALAECGAFVPMISGRGLGHTGGTLDKLEAIPGLNVDVTGDQLRAQLDAVGCAIVSASGQIAPADKRLYAVRDVTSTVESIDLITASILSKKLAAGLGSLVLDVKCGSGAFMADRDRARALAQALVSTANGAGCKTSALITDMDRPLAQCAGNALEVREVLDTLTGQAPTQRLIDLTAELCGEVLALSGLADTAEQGAERVRGLIASGAVAERFARMLHAQGADTALLDSYAQTLPTAPVIRDVIAPDTSATGSKVTRIDTRAIGEVVVHLGGGRLKGGDPIDPSVGLSHLAAPGDDAGPGARIAQIHAATEADADTASAAVLAAYVFGETAPGTIPLLLERVGP